MAKIMDDITIEELKNDCKRLIKERLSSKLPVPNSADILNYAAAIAELEKNELIKKLTDTNPGVFGASSPMEAQLVCGEEVNNERS